VEAYHNGGRHQGSSDSTSSDELAWPWSRYNRPQSAMSEIPGVMGDDYHAAGIACVYKQRSAGIQCTFYYMNLLQTCYELFVASTCSTIKFVVMRCIPIS